MSFYKINKLAYCVLVLITSILSISESLADINPTDSDYKKIALQDSVKPLNINSKKLEEYEKSSKEMIIQFEKIMPDHPIVTNQNIILANIYLTQKRYQEAELIYIKTIAKYEAEKYTGYELASIYNNLAESYREQNKNLLETEQLYKKAIAIDSKSDEIKDVLVVKQFAIDCNNLATFYDKQKNHSTAESLYEQMIKLNQLWYSLAQLKEQTPEAKVMTENYFAFLRKHGKDVKAKQIELGLIPQ